ncbi:halocarboxylic acid dehydrogenase DehI family protein [Bacillus sp. UMB0728]|uniref:halocarboxylic acid dehydrogenase DehI family protein n=1 Tax=Bacillus sp. UMB0728 TaxID=2066052 RepID=UPI0027E47056|nr:halocarboxylic acid dehydrogenase DehI family protein [Bacillus sp. UMB0728]
MILSSISGIKPTMNRGRGVKARRRKGFKLAAVKAAILTYSIFPSICLMKKETVAILKQRQFGIPEIFEESASGSLQLLYGDIKHVLKVPIVNFIFRALAHYEKFLYTGWQQVRPSMLTIHAERAAEGLREPGLSFVPERYNWERILGMERLKRVEKIVFTFNYVNPKLLLIALAWQESLGYRPIKGGALPSGLIEPGILPGLPSIRLIDFPEADRRQRDILWDIMTAKHSYDTASDYRALVLYPEFLQPVWYGMKEYVSSEEFSLRSRNIKEQARQLVHTSFPYPVAITPDELAAMYSQKDAAGIMAVIALFSDFLADLIIEGECIRRFLYPPSKSS